MPHSVTSIRFLFDFSDNDLLFNIFKVQNLEEISEAKVEWQSRTYKKSLWELWDVYYHLSFYETWQNVFIRSDRAAAVPWREAWYPEGDNIFNTSFHTAGGAAFC